MEKVTLGITTYKRVDALSKLLSQVANSEFLKSHFNVLIVNDSGTEDYRKEYDTLLANLSIDLKIIHNDKNLGFPRSFAKLIDESQDDYMLFINDDDFIKEESVEKTFLCLKDKQPSILSGRYKMKNGKNGRGIHETRKIKPAEFRVSSGHCSGLYININQFREFIDILILETEQGNTAAETYPAVIMHIPVLLKHDNSWWFDNDIVIEGDGLPSNVKDSSGKGYRDSGSRFQQLAGFDRFLLKLDDTPSRNQMLIESRAWGIQKAISGNEKVRTRLKQLLFPTYQDKLERKLSRLKSKTKR